ncbi:hypothetical protein [Methylocucumis oryzae]|uniref:Uncharacterized protein n=1 Tax=Methylocucumis oryzae TaxID=1632867 RepID=A0A0F3IN72_9GAMM|nr:hypothetical protein [Methylocucumis oryzae]KJV08008.1 hypothetical protein VZ94_00905 [Methylocucumis oryzae]
MTISKIKGLNEFLFDELIINQPVKPTISDGFIVPGYWATLAAYAKHKNITFDKLIFENPSHCSYSQAICLEKVLSNCDNYPYPRINSGANYSQLVLLNSVDDTDKATNTINNCIRHIFTNCNLPEFMHDLCNVVGDLHDNVWSHGKSTGFSMAQKWQDKSSCSYFFEFALADCGLGFLKELQSSSIGKHINTDKEAIEWCIIEGNSTKKCTNDDWKQSLPPDTIGSPMPNKIGKPKVSENHHLGLGLAKLVKLVNNYNGFLWLASGNCTLHIRDGQHFYSDSPHWKGVALACRFNTQQATQYKNNNTPDEAISSIEELMRYDYE